jgi:DNA-binding transcriptional ArsR family regulator
MAYATNGWAALADPTRRTIFERLIEHPSAVSELACELPVSRPAVSQHLKVLKDAGLVVDKRAGKQRIYQVDPDGLAALRAELDRFWTKTLATYKTVVEQPKGDPMNIRAADTSVRLSIVVEAPISRAFKVFTEDFGSFKPAEHNILGVEIAETVFEPKVVGGFLYDRGVDGSVCRWARVLAYDPPNRVLLSWDISPQWRIEDDPLKTSEWEVRFIAETPDRTRVEIEHRNLDRHGEGWQEVRGGVAGDQGWPLYLQRYANLLAKKR